MQSLLAYGRRDPTRSGNAAKPHRRVSPAKRQRVLLEALEGRWMLATNPIVTENQLPGTPQSTWDVSGSGDATLQGFSTDISTNVGGTVSFKITDTAKAPYRIDIYRMGYYQGNGARLVTSIPSSQTLDVVQPAPLSDATTKLVDCGNWSVTASWQVPTTAVSGIYFARLVRTDTGGASRIVFVVRNDASHSQVLFQTSDSTWEAYNSYGGQSFYGTPAQHDVLNNRAYAVSYNRPLTIDSGSDGYTDYNSPFHAEYPMVRWMEANGYDVSYFSDLDAARLGAGYIEQHQVYMSVGHDEYWSNQQGANVRAARDAGVNLAFFSGNESFWETRWGTSIDSSHTPNRTLICYKESYSPPLDPTDPPGWTGTWRDPRQPGGSNAENGLSGTMYMNDRTSTDIGVPLNVPASDANLRFWRNTAVAKLTGSQVASLGAATVGYEVDEDLDNGLRPAGLMDMSTTTFSTSSHVTVPWGVVVAPGTGKHSITLYRAASGALVFGAGTVQWSWGLDGTHNDGGSTPDASIQQATVNLLADMGSQPATLRSGLVAATQSTDHTAPTSTITSPTPNATVSGTVALTVTGTASDAGGGVVAGVEVSVDGGKSWHPATGKNTWTYTFTPSVLGAFKILSRAVDDSANLETPGAGVTVNSAGPMSFWGGNVTPYNPTDTDTSSIEVGVKFRSDIAGYITGIRFYKGSTNTGTHVGSLWTASGALLAQATFTNESASGWQTVTFSQPVPINANTTYVASYHAPKGNYAEDDSYFQNGYDNTTLHALASGVDGPNGVYNYGAGSVFPTQTFLNANYYVDVLFNTTANDTVPPSVVSKSPAAGATNVFPQAAISVSFSEPIKPSTLSIVLKDSSNNTIAGTLSYNSATNTGTFTPSAPLATTTTFTATASGAQDLAGNTMSPVIWSFTTSAPVGQGPFSIWSTTTVPATPVDSDPSSSEVGVKFRSDVSGQITAIRFYKGSTNTGTHVGDLWSSSGQLLASGTFTNETATGWQTLTLATSVTITPNTTYVASYHTNVGHYAEDDNYFTGAGVDNGPLHALKAGVDGANGVYAYGPAGTFPTQDYLSANYYIDVVLSTSDTTPPTLTTKSPASGATNVPTNTTVSATFSEAVQSSTIAFTLKDAGGNTVPATVSYNAGTNTATLTPSAALAGSTTYTATVSGAKDIAGNVMTAPVTWSFTTVVPDTTPPTVTAQSPASGAANVPMSTTVTATFSESVQASTISFTLKTSGGQTVAGTVAYNDTNHTATFTPTSLLAAGTTYTATVSGAADLSGNVMSAPSSWSFTTAAPDTTPPSVATKTPAAGATGVATNASVTATFSEAIQPSTLVFTLKDSSGNSVAAQVTYNVTTLTATLTPSAALANLTTYTATVSGAQDLAGNTMSLVSWSFTTVPDTTSPTVSAQSPAPGSTNIAVTTAVSATFSEAVQAATIVFTLKDASNNPVAATVSYNASTGVATLTPSVPLVGSTTYTATVSGAKDLAGNTMSPASWSFTTAVPIGGGPFSVWGPSHTPANPSDPDSNAVELGMKFQSDTAGYVTGVRFYKGTTNTGTHIGNLWSSTGTLLATGTFGNETASGWQQLNFATPVSINANTTYIVSYHTNVGHYAGDDSFFTAGGVDNGPLHALSDAAGGGNGVYAYGAASAFPSNTFDGSNYWVDVVFTKNYFLQSTVADFNGGATSGSSITNNAGGEVQLTPLLQDDFNGSTLSSTWTTTALGGGSAAVSLSGGILSMGSAEIKGGVTTSPVEARLTFAAAANQRFGLATDYAANAGNYWAAFTTNTTTTTLYAQVNLNGTLTTTSLGALSGFSGYHVYRVQPISTGFQFWVDGVLKLTISKVIPAGTNLRMALGAAAATPATQADWARVASYTSGGTFVSSVLDAGRIATWGAAQLTAALPAGTTIVIETSSGNTATPDGSWSAWSAVGPGNVITSPPARYLRYRITLITTDPTQTPTLSDILFAWS